MKTKKKLTLIAFNGLTNLPGKLAKMKDRWSQKDLNGSSSFVPPASASRALAVSSGLYDLFADMAGTGSRSAFVGITKNGTALAELTDGNGNVQIATCEKAGDGTLKFNAAVHNGSVYEQYDEDTRKGTVLLLSLFGIAQMEPECHRYYDEVQQYLTVDPESGEWDADNGKLLEEFSKSLCRMSSNLYYRITAPENAGTFRLDYSPNVGVLREAAIQKQNVQTVLCGEPKFFQTQEEKEEAVKNSDVKAKYDILSKGRVLTEDERKMLIDLPDWYVFPKWALTLANKVSLSGMFKKPIRSMLLVGPSGAGKTKGAQALSYLLGIPYTKITCSPDSSMFDFIGQLIPNTAAGKGKSTEEAMKELDIPTFDDVEFDFEGSYKKLFGKEPDSYSLPQDCYSEITRRLMATGSKPDSDFIYVESELIRALRNGWFVEIQEPTVIKRNSVLVGLNGLLEDDLDEASITLMTGETIKRHPDAVVCMTSNRDYDGCNKIQQSVLSRMQIVRKLGNPTPAVMAERCIKETNFPNKGIMKTMAEMIQSINDYCNKSDITDGVCGPRELSNWAKETMLNATIERGDCKIIENLDVIRAAFSTLLNKASQTDEDVEDIITGCFQVVFPMSDVEIAREEYEAGEF